MVGAAEGPDVVRVAVTGAGGSLGSDVAPALGARGHDVVALVRGALDVTDAAACRAALAEVDAVVHAAAWTDVDGCEGDPERAHAVNAEGTRNVVEAAPGAMILLVGTDYVFDGTLGRAYVEDDATNPIQVYGRTKLAAEELALASGARVAVARSAWLYGARGGFVGSIVRAAERGPIEVVDDQVGSPTATADLAVALVALVEAGTTGVFHVANAGAASRYDLARAAVAEAGLDPALVRPVRTAAMPRPARRPAFAPLEGRAWAAAGFAPLPSWESALRRAIPAIVR